MFTPSRIRSLRAFTLVELLAVVIILGILMAILVPTFLNSRDDAQDQSASSELVTAYHRASVYWVDEEQFPTSQTLVTRLSEDEPGITFAETAELNTGTAAGDGTVRVYSDGNRVAFTKLSASGAVMYLTDDRTPATGTGVASNFPVPGASAAGAPQNPGGGDPQNPGGGDPQNPGGGDPSGAQLYSFVSYQEAPANGAPFSYAIQRSTTAGALTDTILNPAPQTDYNFGVDAAGNFYSLSYSTYEITRRNSSGATTATWTPCESGETLSTAGVARDGSAVVGACTTPSSARLVKVTAATGAETTLVNETTSNINMSRPQITDSGVVYFLSADGTTFTGCPNQNYSGTSDGTCVWKYDGGTITRVTGNADSMGMLLSGDGSSLYFSNAAVATYSYPQMDCSVSPCQPVLDGEGNPVMTEYTTMSVTGPAVLNTATETATTIGSGTTNFRFAAAGNQVVISTWGPGGDVYSFLSPDGTTTQFTIHTTGFSSFSFMTNEIGPAAPSYFGISG